MTSGKALPVPIEVVLPLHLIRPNNNGSIIYAAENFHSSGIHANYPELAKFWFKHKELGSLATSPLDRLRKISGTFALSSKLDENDADDDSNNDGDAGGDGDGGSDGGGDGGD